MQGSRVAVIGGSIAGCAATLAAVRAGAASVTVYERAGGELRDRGVGISLHDDRYSELHEAGYVTPEMPYKQLDRRVWTVRDGDTGLGRGLATQPFPFRAYNWGSLWQELRRRVPEGVDYRSRAAVAAVSQDADGVTVRLAGGGEERHDAVVGADGYRSVVREAMFPHLSPLYAGYVGWRGAGTDAGGAWPDDGEARTVVFPGGHCVIYRILTADGSSRVNWVLYTAPPEELAKELNLDEPTSLPPGRLSSQLTTYLRQLVAEHFPPYWAESILGTPPDSTILQPIYDLEVPGYAQGRLCLAGDAATVARPHIGGGSVKALQDAAALESSWREATDWDAAMAAYDRGRTEIGTAMVAQARRLGRAQVEETPDWAGLDEEQFQGWWQEQNRTPDGRSGFGGHAMRRG
ncbi:FAD-dependent monooxygenase [Streptomyces sp. XM4193]|uniref:FAD-dependent monooxygenase n=1 Tax=Streptomyces sp. XM4193 TaxID=2929782 RepID=UPI001FF70A50|nr:FAD-dependent monooxygenase [Streptomyces sp. XM4193]MCK1795007.1 FAD-dependent monooxygenase [Streptomyces sp. XM4193]